MVLVPTERTQPELNKVLAPSSSFLELNEHDKPLDKYILHWILKEKAAETLSNICNTEMKQDGEHSKCYNHCGGDPAVSQGQIWKR